MIRNTLKQRRLISALPKAKTLAEAGRLAGYTKQGHNIYRRNITKHIREVLGNIGYSDAALKQRFNLGADLALQNKDCTNYLRANEDLARMAGAFKDKLETKQEMIPTEEFKIWLLQTRRKPAAPQLEAPVCIKEGEGEKTGQRQESNQEGQGTPTPPGHD